MENEKSRAIVWLSWPWWLVILARWFNYAKKAVARIPLLVLTGLNAEQLNCSRLTRKRSRYAKPSRTVPCFHFNYTARCHVTTITRNWVH